MSRANLKNVTGIFQLFKKCHGQILKMSRAFFSFSKNVTGIFKFSWQNMPNLSRALKKMSRAFFYSKNVTGICWVSRAFFPTVSRATKKVSGAKKKHWPWKRISSSVLSTVNPHSCFVCCLIQCFFLPVTNLEKVPVTPNKYPWYFWIKKMHLTFFSMLITNLACFARKILKCPWHFLKSWKLPVKFF